LTGTTRGPLRRGMTRSAARTKLRRFRAMRSHMDDFCLARGAGIRVLYPTPRLLKRQSRKQRARINNRIVLAVTANRFYSLGGVKPGTRLAPALRKLHSHPRGIHAGLNFWYVVKKGRVSYVLKVRRGVVLEIGVVDRPLTRTIKAQRVFFTTFSG